MVSGKLYLNLDLVRMWHVLKSFYGHKLFIVQAREFEEYRVHLIITNYPFLYSIILIIKWLAKFGRKRDLRLAGIKIRNSKNFLRTT